MSHNFHFFNPIRRRVLPLVDKFLKKTGLDEHGLYVSSELSIEEFVAIVDMSPKEFEEHITHGHGFNENPVSSHKTFRGNYEWGTWAWRGFPEKEQWRPHPFSPMQLHVVVVKEDGHEDSAMVFAHWEDNWVTRPLRHYRGENFDAERGVELMKDFFDFTGVPTHTSPNRSRGNTERSLRRK